MLAYIDPDSGGLFVEEKICGVLRSWELDGGRMRRKAARVDAGGCNRHEAFEWNENEDGPLL